MRLKPFLLIALLALFAVGCDRGATPRMIGSPAPDFTVTDSDRTVSLHDFRGKLVILNFWASWCPPCADEMPSLIQLQRRMGSKVTVLAVSRDASESDYRNFLLRYRVDFLTVRDPGLKSWDLYGTTGQPETFIIDPSGVIRRKFVGPVDWNSREVNEYLSKL